MKVIQLNSLEPAVRSQLLMAITEPLLIVEDNVPMLVVRNLLEDDAADELIAQHTQFRESIQRAREQKAAGEVVSLQDLRAKYLAAGEQ